MAKANTPPAARKSKISVIAASTFTIVAAIILAFPFYWMMVSGLKSSAEIFVWPPVLFPKDIQWVNIQRAFELQPLARQLFNSAYIATLVVAGVLVVSSLAGYALARIPFPGRNLIMVILLAALLMPTEVMLIPLYIIYQQLGWLGTHLPLIITPILGAPAIVGTFLMRQYFLSMPAELEDAARIDGLGRFGILWRIAVPLAKPALASVIILTFLSSWNSFIEPLVFVGGPDDLVTVPVGLTHYIDSLQNPIWEVQSAAAAISIIPILIVFLFFQRSFIEGISRVGIHG